MAERAVVGVDFSGGAGDRHTWAAGGFLDTATQSLTLLSCQPVSRQELAGRLRDLDGAAVAALDFPFSVPAAFAEYAFGEYAAPEYRNGAMPGLWRAAAGMELAEFTARRDAFVREYGELLRAGDLYVPGCYSCLHRANPNMLPMTLRGMQLLDGLWAAGCRVPPLDGPAAGGGAALLEVMPGAALRAFGLPHKGYKGGRRAFDNRRKILRELPQISGVKVVNLDDFRDECMFSDDALDAIVAAVAAALWALDDGPGRFRHPGGRAVAAPGGKRQVSPQIIGRTELEAAKREGWIYVPTPPQAAVGNGE